MYTFNDEQIRRIKENPLDYSGYVELGDLFAETNPKQAYLCYENAIFLCRNNDKTELEKKLEMIAERAGRVNRCAIVVLSYNNRQVTQQCLESIRENTPESSREIIIIDNDSKDDSVDYLREQKDIVLIENKENMGFPKGCNQGIEVASKDTDILLLNNDVVVMPNTMFWLRMGLYADDCIGAAGSVANKAHRQISGAEEATMEYFYSHAMETNIPMKNPLEFRTWLVGFCLLLKREVIDKIGVLDEMFSPGNGEDEDICLRVLKAGYCNVLVRNSYLVHLEHKSFDKRPDYYQLIYRGWKRLAEKYGEDLTPYLYIKELLSSLLYDNVSGKRVLDINCGMGISVMNWALNLPEIEFEGIDRDVPTSVFRISNPFVKLSNYSDIKYAPVTGRYDCITFDTGTIGADEIEKYLEFCVEHLEKNGKIILLAPDGHYYKYWYESMLYGKCSSANNNVATRQEISGYLEKYNLGIQLHMVYYSIPERNTENEALYKITDNLPEEIASQVYISDSGLVLAVNK